MLKWMLRVGFSRGVLGGSRLFTAIGAVAFLLRLAQKIAGTAPKTLSTHKLEPGQVLIVTDVERRR